MWGHCDNVYECGVALLFPTAAHRLQSTQRLHGGAKAALARPVILKGKILTSENKCILNIHISIL